MKLLRVHQNLASSPSEDVAAAVRRSLDDLGVDVPSGEIAITAGSEDNAAHTGGLLARQAEVGLIGAYGTWRQDLQLLPATESKSRAAQEPTGGYLLGSLPRGE